MWRHCVGYCLQYELKRMNYVSVVVLVCVCRPPEWPRNYFRGT